MSLLTGLCEVLQFQSHLVCQYGAVISLLSYDGPLILKCDSGSTLLRVELWPLLVLREREVLIKPLNSSMAIHVSHFKL